MSDVKDVSSEEETAVRRFVFKGTKYLKAEDNTLYDVSSHEEIGTWNAETQTIELVHTD